jgi:AcrR family transcriptional regulator
MSSERIYLLVGICGTMTETRNHILEVARTQFFKTGYSGTSINSIVDATKFTKPTVYYHFKNKAELFASLVHDAYDRCFEHRQNAVDTLVPASEQVYQVIAADFAFCLATPDLVRFVVALTFALPEDHSIDLTAIHSRDHEFFRALIERGMSTGEFDCLNAGDAAIALQGLIAINILSYLKMGHGPEFLSPERAHDVADVLLHGIAGKEESKGHKKGRV